MAWTSPRTWVAGAVATAAQMNAHVRDNFKALLPGDQVAWVAYTPTLTQSATVTKTTTLARWTQIGQTIHGIMYLTVTGAGTAANAVTPGLPATAAWSNANEVIGMGFVYDSSAVVKYRGLCVAATTTTIQFLTLHSTADGLLGAVDFTAALAVNDLVCCRFTYEAA